MLLLIIWLQIILKEEYKNVSPHILSSSECQTVLIELIDKLTKYNIKDILINGVMDFVNIFVM